MSKYIFVTGGVVSGLGKGITAASLGRLLKQRGLKVAAQKLDPYMNIDPGTMSPFQHGEVFVTDDGAETDLDLGHYERFIDENLTKHSNLTSGKVYWNVLNRERTGGYSGEHKSKPAQHSVKELRSMGISPNIIVARADKPLSGEVKEKISLFCNVKPDCVIENTTLASLYEAPLMLRQNGLDKVVCRELGIDAPQPDLSEWRTMTQKIKARKKGVTIALVGKYVRLHDAYLSIIESLNHAGFETGAAVSIHWIDSETVTDENAKNLLRDADGMIIPGGFGDRGIEGKITACRYARENDIPFLGICLGMQIAVIEFARNVCRLEGANSGEFDEAAQHKVIDFMPGQSEMLNSGGTMRLGAYPCKVKSGSLLYRLYGAENISERHRHRFEFNNDYRKIFTDKGLIICGESPDGSLAEAIELPDKRFFVGVQYHPEFKSRPNRPHPLFVGLVREATELL